MKLRTVVDAVAYLVRYISRIAMVVGLNPWLIFGFVWLRHLVLKISNKHCKEQYFIMDIASC